MARGRVLQLPTALDLSGRPGPLRQQEASVLWWRTARCVFRSARRGDTIMAVWQGHVDLARNDLMEQLGLRVSEELPEPWGESGVEDLVGKLQAQGLLPSDEKDAPGTSQGGKRDKGPSGRGEGSEDGQVDREGAKAGTRPPKTLETRRSMDMTNGDLGRSMSPSPPKGRGSQDDVP